jgi:SAM-dependent methyltransferase
VRSSAFEVASSLPARLARDLALGHGVAPSGEVVSGRTSRTAARDPSLAAVPHRPPFTALADVYDAIMQDVPYEAWCDFLLREATLRGWRGTRLLDLGCGTGLATAPMLARGYGVTGVDASEAMARRARSRCPDAEIVVADVRTLELAAPFDLAYAVFDVLNNLVDDGDLVRALASVRSHLVPGGWLAFDANTSEGLRSLWEDGVAEGWVDGVHYRWRHTWDEGRRRATVDAYCQTAAGAFVERHEERPFDVAELEAAMAEAGFERVEVVTYPQGRPAGHDAERVWVFGRRPPG